MKQNLSRPLGNTLILFLVASTAAGQPWFDVANSGTVADVQRAIAAGADVNTRADKGATALIYAAALNENPAVVITLLDAGADAKPRDTSGKTAIDLIKDNQALRNTDAFFV